MNRGASVICSCSGSSVGLLDTKMIRQTINTYCVKLTSLSFARDVIGMPLCPRGIHVVYDDPVCLQKYNTDLAQMHTIQHGICSLFEKQQNMFTPYICAHVFEQEVKKSKSKRIFLSAINISICYLLSWKFRNATALCNSHSDLWEQELQRGG